MNFCPEGAFKNWLIRFVAVATAGAAAAAAAASFDPVPESRTIAMSAAIPLTSEFEQAVATRLRPPPEVVAVYATRLGQELDLAGVRLDRRQFVALVDRSPNVQALLLFVGGAEAAWRLVGAAPVSTGLPGRYEHFKTPLGVFDHSVAHDRHGVLDGDYLEKLVNGSRFWVLRDDRMPTPWSGRYLVVVDSMADARPDWSPSPAGRAAAVVPPS